MTLFSVKPLARAVVINSRKEEYTSPLNIKERTSPKTNRFATSQLSNPRHTNIEPDDEQVAGEQHGRLVEDRSNEGQIIKWSSPESSGEGSFTFGDIRKVATFIKLKYNKHVVSIDNDECRGFLEMMVKLRQRLLNEVKKVVTIKKTVKIQVTLKVIAKYSVDVGENEKKVYYMYVNLPTSSHKVNIHDVNELMDNILIEVDDAILSEGNINKPVEKIGKSGWKLHRYFSLSTCIFKLEH